ncbi:shikimate dehydrogenase [Tropicimonas sp. IMCC6043]|uniref:shikimate dehydrogenase n=1 Tax=Tropicimonas sp. IMCC6043 TaxID=2510645 RepID=UPI00101CB34C|nr:shikimate dehydrogenase [Tropicimonas sp. IMCC6043]RYH10874.1 shikimate dehydrogenase [Tropicimonas sp. IMCC6043]
MSNRIPLAGVIGAPVAHSLSPKLHGYWLRSYRIAGHYIPIEVTEEDLADVLRMLPRMGFVGANVTIPYKEAALVVADMVTDRAAIIGAANTLIFHEDGRIHADNTDGYGFLSNLRQNAPDWDARKGPAAVLGAGGASRAIVTALLEAGAPEVRISTRTRARADAMRTEFGPKISVHDWSRAGAMFAGAATVVNTTSLGMAGEPEMKISFDALTPGAVVTDAVYVPLRTRFLEEAAARGCHTVDGLGMLLHQAVPGFERWFGHRPEVNEALRAAVLSE